MDKKKRVQAVLFDMDGLMFDTEIIYINAWKKTGKRLNIPIGDEFLMQSRGMIRKDSRQLFETLYQPSMDYEEIIELRQQFVEEELQKGVDCKKGLKELLDYLKEQDYRIALATSTPKERAIRLLDQTNTTSYFDSLIFGDMVERGKPEPDIFIEAAKSLGQKPEHCLVLEDSRNGIVAGKRAGCQVIMIPDLILPTEEIKELTNAIFESLLDVITWLQKN